MISLFRNFKDIKNHTNKSIVAIGNFDGLHHGHKAIVNQAKLLKRKYGGKFIILTFHPHPLKVLRPGNEPKNILSFRNKVIKMRELGVDILLAQRFNIAFSKLTPLDFIHEVLIDGLNVSDIIIGDDFHFGYKRQGNIDYLMSAEFRKHFNVHIINKVSGKSGRYSSSLARDMIASGKMMEVKEVLGYFYEVEGHVVKGEQLGNKLGFPTANINYLNTVIPEDGIYAGWVKIKDKFHMGAISTGYRPQFKGKKRFLEAHLLNFSGDIYGTRIKVSLVKKIRDEQVFSDIEKLKKQMTMDCKKAINILTENNI